MCKAEVEAAVCPAEAALEEKRAALFAGIVAARLEAQAAARVERKAKAEDFFTAGEECAPRFEDTNPADRVKDYRMQGEYGAKKFIKP
jgi:hypothetical protein